MKYRAISLRQPWANMIAAGEKTIETRTWSTRYRGELLIVSSLAPKIEPAGCAVALVRLVTCRRMQRGDEERACVPFREDLFSWVLEDIRSLEPFRVRGRLGLYEIDIGIQLICARKEPL